MEKITELIVQALTDVLDENRAAEFPNLDDNAEHIVVRLGGELLAAVRAGEELRDALVAELRERAAG